MFRKTSLVVLSCLLLTVLAGTPKEHLLRDLLDGYEADVDPGNIKLNLNLILACASWDDDTDTVTAIVWESHQWKDSRLTWIPSEYGGLDTLRVPDELIWTPDTKQYISMSAETERDDINAVLKSDGSILWVPRTEYEVPCTGSEDTEITCEWRVGSWTYDGNSMQLVSEEDDPLDVSQYYVDSCPLVVARHEAEIVSHTYPCCKEPYPTLDATIVFKKRKP